MKNLIKWNISKSSAWTNLVWETKGAEESFDVLSKGGDGLAVYGAKKENPLLIV